MTVKGKMQKNTKTEAIIRAYDHARVEADKSGHSGPLPFKVVFDHLQQLEEGAFPEVMEIDTTKKLDDTLVARRWGKLISAALRKHRPENTTSRQKKRKKGSRAPNRHSWAVPQALKTTPSPESEINMGEMVSLLEEFVERLSMKGLLLHEPGREVGKTILEMVSSKL